jgi:hypothetical protein
MSASDSAELFTWYKHNELVVYLANSWFRARTRNVEKFIFTATSGRSGTMSLQKAFEAVPDCLTLHEPHPFMNGPVLQAASEGRDRFVDRYCRQVKLIHIRRAAVGYRYYLESNHNFIKTFARQAVEEFGNRIAVIHLVRSPLDVAMSIYRLQHYPGTRTGDAWFLDHRAPANLLQMSEVLDSDPEFSHAYYKALWYWYEVELRIAKWRAQMPFVKVVRFDTENFNNKDRLIQLFNDIGVRYDESRLESVIGLKENVRTHHKSLAAIPADQAAGMLRKFQRLLADRGVDLSVIHPSSHHAKSANTRSPASSQTGLMASAD